MKSVRYGRYTGEDLGLSAEDLLQALANFFLESGFGDPYMQFSEFNQHSLENLKRAIEEALARGDSFDAERAEQIRRQLAPLCERLVIPAQPSLFATSKLWHLATRIEGQLHAEQSALTFACRLHPTPALCGFPTDVAKRLIGELEPFDRGVFCGIVGWKPSRQRISTEGAFPLSFSLDSIGPMATSVADCANTDAVMAGDWPHPVEAAPLAGLRFGIPPGFPLAQLDETVTAAFQAALKTLAKAGVRLSDETIPLLDDMVKANALGGFAPAEAYAIHRDRLKRRGKDVDANVYARVSRGETISAADYVDMNQMRRRLVAAMDARMSDFDALVLPTCPIVAPRLDEVATVETFGPKNMLTLRNTSTGNFFDLCAISLPMPRGKGGLATGLMLFGRNGQDARLFRIAAAVEKALAA